MNADDRLPHARKLMADRRPDEGWARLGWEVINLTHCIPHYPPAGHDAGCVVRDLHASKLPCMDGDRFKNAPQPAQDAGRRKGLGEGWHRACRADRMFWTRPWHQSASDQVRGVHASRYPFRIQFTWVFNTPQ